MKDVLEKQFLFYEVIVRTYWMTLVIEADKEAEEPESTEVIPEAKGADRGIRPSQRHRKVPQRLGLYYTHQITNRPVDRRLQTLQTLIGSGILNELDSDMTNSILDAVIK